MNNLVIAENETANSIGDILVLSGRLKTADIARIVRHQDAESLAFGEAAVSLNILTQQDIDYALAKQFDYAYLASPDIRLSEELVAAYKPFSKVGENLRAVRSQLLLRWFNQDKLRKFLAIVSPAKGDGRSFIAANLAVMFAQQGQRTLLIDANLRNPRQEQLFKLGKSKGLSVYLSGRANLEVIQTVPGINNLSVIVAGPSAPNPQELLGRKTFKQLMNDVANNFDIVLIDTPAANEYSDAEIIASQVGAAMLVARENVSLMSQTTNIINRLQDNGVTVVGSILNDS